jgi:hypothetical protein
MVFLQLEIHNITPRQSDSRSICRTNTRSKFCDCSNAFSHGISCEDGRALQANLMAQRDRFEPRHRSGSDRRAAHLIRL